MTLLNKDGTVFKLPCANPIMVEQNSWKGIKCIFHNNFGKTAIYNKNLVPLNLKENEEIRPIEISKEYPSSILPEPRKLVATNINTENAILIWCLPAFYEEKIDELYGEKYKKIRYGNKFIFEGIIHSSTDFNINIITSVVGITENSILYPKNYDKRWWRVSNINFKNDLYYIIASLSDFQPRFS